MKLLLTLLPFIALLACTGNQDSIVDAPAPELVGSEWINTPDAKPVQLADRKGKVTVVHFWTFGCINCRHNLNAYNRVANKFEKQGVMLIGIHTPELDFERNVDTLKKKIVEYGIKYPVLVDGKGQNWDRWKNQYWPAIYLVDKHGKVRSSWFGELEWNGAGGEAKMNREIERLLAE